MYNSGEEPGCLVKITHQCYIMIKPCCPLQSKLSNKLVTTNMTDNRSNKDISKDNVLHDEEEYGDKGYNVNKSANEKTMPHHWIQSSSLQQLKGC